MKQLRRKEGISLVALVITIIVLIILTGAVIVTFIEGGIIDRAKEAVFKNDIRTYQQILSLKKGKNEIENQIGNGENRKVINGTSKETIKEILPEFKDEYENIVAIENGEIVLGANIIKEDNEKTQAEKNYTKWLEELGIGLKKSSLANFVNVGDYILYDVDGETSSYQISGEESGYDPDETGTPINQTVLRENGQWRVLSKDGGVVKLISASSLSDLGLGGANGYLNGTQILNDTCETLYSGTMGTARSVNIEDINKLLNFDGNDETKWKYVNSNNKLVSVPKGCKTIAQLEEYENKQLTCLDPNGADISNYTPNDYGFNKMIQIDSNIPSLAYPINGGNWIASTCVSINFAEDFADCNIRVSLMSTIGAYWMYCMCGSAEDYYIDSTSWNLGLRPVVTLNSMIEIAQDNTGDGKSAETAWKIELK